MYSGLPTRARRVVKTVLVTAWALSACAGITTLLMPTSPALAALGPFWSYLSGMLLLISTLVAAVGVATSRYRWEWVAAWAAATAAVPYTLTLWGLVIAVSPDRMTAAFLTTSLVSFYALRALLCAAHAAKLREVHQAGTAAIEAVLSEGDKDDGDDAPAVGG